MTHAQSICSFLFVARNVRHSYHISLNFSRSTLSQQCSLNIYLFKQQNAFNIIFFSSQKRLSNCLSSYACLFVTSSSFFFFFAPVRLKSTNKYVNRNVNLDEQKIKLSLSLPPPLSPLCARALVR